MWLILDWKSIYKLQSALQKQSATGDRNHKSHSCKELNSTNNFNERASRFFPVGPPDENVALDDILIAVLCDSEQGTQPPCVYPIPT